VASDPDRRDAVAALRRGSVVGIPTDTVYGLAVDPTVSGSTDKVFAVKRRPPHLELPVLVGDVDQAESLAGSDGLPDLARRLAARFWPGPLTIVVERRRGLDWALGGDGRTIGLRVPAHALARLLCVEVGPLATTSANRHGEPPFTVAAQLARAFGPELAVVLDGGVCDGAPSTVVDATGVGLRLLREGAIGWDDLQEALR